MPNLVPELSKHFGMSTVVGSIDFKSGWFGKEQVMIHGGTEKIPFSPVEWALELERRGVGEIMLNSIDRDGELCGYDIELVKKVSSAVNVPVITSGGARNLEDFRLAVREGGASAVAAGSMFVFQGKHRAVLITYPNDRDTRALWKE